MLLNFTCFYLLLLIDERWDLAHLTSLCTNRTWYKTWRLILSFGSATPQASPGVLSLFFLPKFKSGCGGINQAQTRPDFHFKLDQDKALTGWLTELTKTNCFHTADVFIWAESETGRDTERGRQKHVASASRLSSNWFVVLSEHVGMWLMYIRTQVRQKTSRLTDLFLFYYSLETFVRNLNFALVHSCVELCQSTSVYVEERL